MEISGWESSGGRMRWDSGFCCSFSFGVSQTSLHSRCSSFKDPFSQIFLPPPLLLIHLKILRNPRLLQRIFLPTTNNFPLSRYLVWLLRLHKSSFSQRRYSKRRVNQTQKIWNCKFCHDCSNNPNLSNRHT